MDETRADLIRQLLTQVGMIMEDASTLALTTSPAQGDIRLAMSDLEQDLAAAVALITAARALSAGRSAQDQRAERG